MKKKRREFGPKKMSREEAVKNMPREAQVKFATLINQMRPGEQILVLENNSVSVLFEMASDVKRSTPMTRDVDDDDDDDDD